MQKNIDAACSLKAGSTCLSDGIIHTFGANTSLGWHDFKKRAAALEQDLVNGTLAVEAAIQVRLEKPEKWNPHMTIQRDMLRLLESKETSDVVFTVGGETFHAHRLILKLRSPCLAELTEDNNEIEINDVDPLVFKRFLHFVYTDEPPEDLADVNQALTFLNVADKFGCTSLKLAAEAELAESHMHINNAMDVLFLADSKNCALLKEASTTFFVQNREAVEKTLGHSQVQESAKLQHELMNAAVNPDSCPRDVAMLRNKLASAGLEVDGTREMLVKRLEDVELD